MFNLAKLLPTKNAIRIQHGSTEKTVVQPPTPFYNSTLASDVSVSSYLKLQHIASKQSDAFRDACILGRIWLRQRGFGSSIQQGGFGNFEWSTLTALLLKGGGPKGRNVLSPGYSSYQLFKAVVQFLATTDMVGSPVIYDATGVVIPKSHNPTFYDGPRGVNVLFKMSPWSYSLLRDEANTSLTMLNDATFDQFQAAFILRTDEVMQRYDILLRFPVQAFAKQPSLGDHGSQIMASSTKLYAVLKHGLTDRVKLIDIKVPSTGSFSIKNGPVNGDLKEFLVVGLVLDPANVDRLVDHGPPAEEKKNAASFQKFWGEKAELRRFKDGSILESLVWSKDPSEPILQQIVSYLLRRHFDSSLSIQCEFIGDGFLTSLLPDQTGMQSFVSLREGFSTFQKDIRNLDSLPLQLRQLSPISAQLRQTSILAPNFNTRRPLATPADVVIQFEGSGRWPDDVVAIQRTKIAFLIKIGELLEEAVQGVSARVGMENEGSGLLNCSYLDVMYPSGAVFRLRIQNEREQFLLERAVKDRSADAHSREEAVTALSIYKRTYVQLPLHTQSLNTHCTRFALLSPTIRLVKNWFSSHMLLEHFNEELLELIAIRTFLQPYPWKAPSSAMTGFLRTLSFISRWDWRLEPLIVDFSGAMSSQDVSAINNRLEAWRKIDPGMNRTVLVAASNHDVSGTAFTEHGPTKVVAARMTALARSACKLVRDEGLGLQPSTLFASSTADYDFILHLTPRFVGSRRGKKVSKGSQFKNLEVQEESGIESVGCDPVQLFIEEIKALYTTSLVLFNDSRTGSVICGLWNPQTSSRPFRVNLAYGTRPVAPTNADDATTLVEINKAAILAEMARLGGDMVARIELRR